MKCDELKQVEYPIEWGLYYDKAEVDAAIAELKARIQLDDDEMAGFLQLEEECGGGDLRNYIAELKRKLEDVQASAYAESVDAGMRERRLKRALWLKRADDAKHLVIAYENYDYFDCQEMTIKQETARTWMTCKLRTAEEWAKVWKNVENKCRAKAEAYK